MISFLFRYSNPSSGVCLATILYLYEAKNSISNSVNCISSSIIKDLGEHPDDKKPVRVMKGQFGPYIKYKSLNATIPEEKDPSEITMEEALVLIEKRKEYDKNKKKGKRKKS